MLDEDDVLGLREDVNAQEAEDAQWLSQRGAEFGEGEGGDYSSRAGSYASNGFDYGGGSDEQSYGYDYGGGSNSYR